jgi:hypothetical protein
MALWSLTAQLWDTDDNVPVVGKPVDFYSSTDDVIFNKFNTVNTDANGYATTEITISQDTWVKAAFAGSPSYAPSEQTMKILLHSTTYQADFILLLHDVVKQYFSDIRFITEKSNQYLIDAYLAKRTPIPYSIDTALLLVLSATYKSDVLFKKLGLTKTYSMDTKLLRVILDAYLVDVKIQKTGMPTYSIDTLLKRFGVTKGFSIDVLIGNPPPPPSPIGINDVVLYSNPDSYKLNDVYLRTYIKTAYNKYFGVDAVIKRLAITKTYSASAVFEKTSTPQVSLDTLFERLGVTKDYHIDLALQRLDITKTTDIDSVFAKLGITAEDDIDILFAKLGITVSENTDVLFKLLDISYQYIVDIILQQLGVTATDTIDAVFQQLGLTLTNTIDAFFAIVGFSPYLADTILEILGLTKIDSIDVLFKKTGITKTDTIDILFKRLNIHTRKTVCEDTNPTSNYDVHLSCYPPQFINWQEVSDNDDNTYVYYGDTPVVEDLYTTESLDIPSDASISQVTVYFRCRSWFHGCYARPRISALGQAVTEGTEIFFGSSWSTQSQTWATNPQTGLPWTIDEAKNLYVGVGIRAVDFLSEGDCSKVYVKVCYTIPWNPLIDVIFKRLDVAKTENIDLILRELGFPMYWVDAVLEKKGITIVYLMDMIFSRLDITLPYVINMLLRKKGLTFPYTVNAISKVLGLTEPITIDTVIKKLGLTVPYSVDEIFMRHGIPKSYAVDVFFTIYFKAISYNLDVVFKKTATKTYSIDALLKELIQKFLGGGQPTERRIKIEYVDHTFTISVHSLSTPIKGTIVVSVEELVHLERNYSIINLSSPQFFEQANQEIKVVKFQVLEEAIAKAKVDSIQFIVNAGGDLVTVSLVGVNMEGNISIPVGRFDVVTVGGVQVSLEPLTMKKSKAVRDKELMDLYDKLDEID